MSHIISERNEEVVIINGVGIRKIRINLTKEQFEYINWDIEIANLKSLSLPNNPSYNVTNQQIELQIPSQLENLEDIINRKKKANQFFTEQEIISTLFQLITVFYQLHKINNLARCVSPRFIRLNNNQICLERCGYVYDLYSPNEYIQIAPELLTQICLTYKIDIWILGMITYNLMFLKPLSDKNNIQDYKQFIDNCQRKGNTFDFLFTPQYSIELVSLVQQMLNFDPERRIEILEIFKIYKDLFNQQSQNNISEMIKFYDKHFRNTQWNISYRLQLRQSIQTKADKERQQKQTEEKLKKSKTLPKQYQVPQQKIMTRTSFRKMVSYSYESIDEPNLLYKFQIIENEKDQNISMFWNKFNFILYQIYLISDLREISQNVTFTDNLTFYLMDVIEDAIKLIKNNRTINDTTNATQCLKQLEWQFSREKREIFLIKEKYRKQSIQVETKKYLEELIRVQNEINLPKRKQIALFVLLLLKDQFKDFESVSDKIPSIMKYNGIYKIDNYMQIHNFIERAPNFYLGELTNSIVKL